MSSHPSPIASRILALVLLVLGAACASFRGEELPQRDLREFQGSERLPAVTYVISNTFPGYGSFQAGGPDRCVDRVFRDVFQEAERKESAGGIHLDLNYAWRTRQPVFTMGLLFFTIASLGVIPTYGRDDLELSVRVEVDGVLAKRYAYEDHVSMWVHLFMIPWAFSHDPQEVQEAVLENTLRNFLYDLRRDLPGFPEPAAG